MKTFGLILLLICSVMHVPRNIQSPYVAADFWTQWGSANPRMALFIKITPQSFWTGASAIGFTSNTRDMTLPGHVGITFKSAPGITPTLVDQVLGETSSIDMQGIYQTGIFEQSDVIAGKWNFAEVEVFSACWDNVNLGELVHFKGNLGEFKDYQTYFTAEGRGLIGRLSRDVDETTQRLCRVKEFGDSRCGKDLNGTITIGGSTFLLTYPNASQDNGQPLAAGTVYLDVTSMVTVLYPDTPPDDFFRNGKIIATSGANEGIAREVSASRLGPGGAYIKIYLKRAFPFLPNVADTFTIQAGCTRTLEDCRKYTNAANFRGEPFVPNIENANRVTSSN